MKPGDVVEFFTTDTGAWVRGKVIAPRAEGEGEMVLVEHLTKTYFPREKLQVVSAVEQLGEVAP